MSLNLIVVFLVILVFFRLSVVCFLDGSNKEIYKDDYKNNDSR